MMHHSTHSEIRISEKIEGRITRGLRQTQPELVKVYRLLSTTTQSSKWPPKLQETPHCNKKATLQHCHKIQHTSLPPDDLRKTFLIASTSPRPHPYPSPRPRTKESGVATRIKDGIFVAAETALMHRETHREIRGVEIQQMYEQERELPSDATTIGNDN